jgi:hypothetical protein
VGEHVGKVGQCAPDRMGSFGSALFSWDALCTVQAANNGRTWCQVVQDRAPSGSGHFQKGHTVGMRITGRGRQDGGHCHGTDGWTRACMWQEQNRAPVAWIGERWALTRGLHAAVRGREGGMGH